MAIQYHCVDLGRVLDVQERVRIEQNEIGKFSFLDCAELSFPSEITCGIFRCGLKRLVGREAGANKQLELVMKTKAGKHERITKIGSRENRHTEFVHHPDRSEQLLESLLTYFERELLRLSWWL